MNITYNINPSKYELEYVKWNGINFDREILIKFIKRLRLTYFFSFIPHYRKEHKILVEILNTYDNVRIQGLLNNDENIIKFLDEWYLQTLKLTTQDQIGFPYVCKKLNMIPYTLPDNEIKGTNPHSYTDIYKKHCHGI